MRLNALCALTRIHKAPSCLITCAIKHNQECFESEPTVQDFRRLDLITIPKAWTRCSNTSKSFLKDLYEHKGDGGGSGKAETKMSQDEVKVDL